MALHFRFLHRFPLFLLMVIVACAVGSAPGWAADEEKQEKADAGLLRLTDKDLRAKLDSNDWKDLLRTAFVLKDARGKEWLFLRLTEAQSLRVKAQPKQLGLMRCSLLVRQRLAIRHALKLDGSAPRVVFRISAKRVHMSRGLKAHYIVRPAAWFKDLLKKDQQEVSETDDTTAQPDEATLAAVDGLKDVGEPGEAAVKKEK